jgi:hypothetical protein
MQRLVVKGYLRTKYKIIVNLYLQNSPSCHHLEGIVNQSAESSTQVWVLHRTSVHTLPQLRYSCNWVFSSFQYFLLSYLYNAQCQKYFLENILDHWLKYSDCYLLSLESDSDFLPRILSSKVICSCFSIEINISKALYI